MTLLVSATRSYWLFLYLDGSTPGLNRFWLNFGKNSANFDRKILKNDLIGSLHFGIRYGTQS